MKILLSLILLGVLAGCELVATDDAGVRSIRWKVSPWPPSHVTRVPAAPAPPPIPQADPPVVYRQRDDF